MVVNPGGTNQSFVDEHIKQAQIIRVQNNVDNLQALRQKTADMMVTDLIEGDYYQSKEPGVFCVANETPFAGTASNKVYMMSKDNPALLEKVNQWLDSQTKRFSNGSGKFAVNRGGAPPPADMSGGGYRPRLALRRQRLSRQTAKVAGVAEGGGQTQHIAKRLAAFLHRIFTTRA